MTDKNKDSAPNASSESQQPRSRRDFLRGAVAGVAGGVAAAVVIESSMNFVQPESVLAQSSLSPDAALKELIDGNGRFVSGKTIAHKYDVQTLRHDLMGKQEPYAAVLACADSRVPVEIVFDQTVGHLFVTRVAGNMITPEIIASLEFGVAVLGTKVIMILGHSDCGAVKAAIANKTVPGQISALYPYIQPAVDKSGPDTKAVTATNAEIQAHLLSESSTVIAGKIKEGQLKVVAGYYDVGTGTVTLLD